MAIIEVAIGVALLFFLLSIVSSTLNEWIAWALSLRAQMLEKGLRELIQDPSRLDALLSHPLIAPLTKKNRLLAGIGYRSKPVMPSYLPARTFALAFVDSVVPAESGGAPPTIEMLRAKIGGLPDVVKKPLLAQLDASSDKIEEFRKGVETWYDSSMERVSGWYKRQTQLVLIAIAVAATVGLNADSYHVAATLWQEPAMRSAIADATARGIEACKDQPVEACETYGTAAQQTEALRSLPIGWSNVPVPDDAIGWIARIFGWLTTVVAVSLGASFWFDVLGKLANLRAAGSKPSTRKTDDERHE
jgi:hypothetical protein